MYVAIEGIDTAGKSTQIKALKDIPLDALFTQEPSNCSFGKSLKNLILSNNLDSKCEFFLFLANRAEHIKNTILPNIDKTIISDRSCISGMAYAKDMKKEDIIYLNKLATNDILPDRVVILTLEKQELEKRLLNKKNSDLTNLDSIEQRGIDYLLTIQENMISFCDKLQIPHICINANEEIENITDKIIDFIKKK